MPRLHEQHDDFHDPVDVARWRITLPTAFEFEVFTICEDIGVITPHLLQCLSSIFRRFDAGKQHHQAGGHVTTNCGYCQAVGQPTRSIAPPN